MLRTNYEGKRINFAADFLQRLWNPSYPLEAFDYLIIFFIDAAIFISLVALVLVNFVVQSGDDSIAEGIHIATFILGIAFIFLSLMHEHLVYDVTAAASGSDKLALEYEVLVRRNMLLGWLAAISYLLYVVMIYLQSTGGIFICGMIAMLSTLYRSLDLMGWWLCIRWQPSLCTCSREMAMIAAVDILLITDTLFSNLIFTDAFES